MNHTRVLSLFVAGGVITLCVAAYLMFTSEEATTHGVNESAPGARVVTAATGQAPIAPHNEITSWPATVQDRLKKDATDEHIATLSAKVKRLEQHVEALDQALQCWLAASPAASQEERSEAPERGDPRTDPHALAQYERQEQERAQTLEANFWNEPTSTSQWSSHASSALEKALAAAPAGTTQVNGLECRSRQCRVELVFYDEVSRTTLMSALPQQLAEILPTIAIHHAERYNGTTTLVLYLFGEGYQSSSTSG